MTHMRRDGLSGCQVIAYSMGHMGNDITGALWFFYLSFFLKIVLGINESLVGLALLVGQAADGFCTPFVGIIEDKFETRIGSKIPWYIFGSFLILPS